MSKKILHVPLGSRSYDVQIGNNIFSSLLDFFDKCESKQKKVILITEEKVASLYLGKITALLESHNKQTIPLILPAGEATKSFENVQKIVTLCLEHHVERSHYILALGGGVIGDLTGFSASMVRRGCGFIQIPTTLLSQVDSSVGGKTGINTPYGKNLIGSFYQPSFVIADTQTLQTLTERDYLSGFAEVLKYGLLGDSDFFSFLCNNKEAFFKREADFLQRIVAHSIQMKADIVVQDEQEKGKRALLNLGHTFGHAYETLTGYSHQLLHGEAVAIGMVDAFLYAAKHGFCSIEDALFVKKAIHSFGLPVDIKTIAPNLLQEDIHNIMQQDKKVIDGNITLILPRKIGNSFIHKKAKL